MTSEACTSGMWNFNQSSFLPSLISLSCETNNQNHHNHGFREIGNISSHEVIDMLESKFDEVSVTLHAAERVKMRFGHLESNFFAHLFREACVKMHRKRRREGDRRIFKKTLSFIRRGEGGCVLSKPICIVNIGGMKFCFVKDPTIMPKNGKNRDVALLTVCI